MKKLLVLLLGIIAGNFAVSQTQNYGPAGSMMGNANATVGPMQPINSMPSGFVVNDSNLQSNAAGTILGNCSNSSQSPSAISPSIGAAINISCPTYGAKSDMIIASRSVSITANQNTLTVAGASFASSDVGKMISIAGAGVTPTATGVSISGTTGQFSCTCTNVAVGQTLTISGTAGGTGSITGYTNPTSYYVSATNGTSSFTLVSAGANGTPLTTSTGSLTGLTYTFATQPLIATIASYSSATSVRLSQSAGTTLSSSSQIVAYGTDNATAIQNAINAAITNDVPVYIPSTGATSCFGYTAPLTINGNLKIVGDYSAENWGGNINVPASTPALLGSVLCPSSNGNDAIDIDAESLSVSASNVAVLFQTPFVNTGHGINATPPNLALSSEQGLSGSLWENIKIYGVDGNHYAYEFLNPIYDSFVKLHAYGGGGLQIAGSSYSGKHYGNSTFYDIYLQGLVGGESDVVSLSAASTASLNILHFIRPQTWTNSTSGPGTISGSQANWRVDTNTTFLEVDQPDWETTVSAQAYIWPSSGNNTFDVNHGVISSSLASPDWQLNGVLSAGQSRTVLNTTSTGNVALEVGTSIPALTMSAISATTVTGGLVTLYLPQPAAGANVTAANLYSLYTAGAAVVSGNLTSTSTVYGNNVVSLGQLQSTSPSQGVGYQAAAGAGGTVTQATSRTTGVTLNKITGQINMYSAAGSASWSSFTVTDSAVRTNDVIMVSQTNSGSNVYQAFASNVQGGSFQFNFETTGGTAVDAPIFNFAIFRAVSN